MRIAPTPAERGRPSSWLEKFGRHGSDAPVGGAPPAEVASRKHDRSCSDAAGWLTIWLIMVGTLMRIVGRKRPIFWNSTSAVAASGNSTVAAPTENGNKRFEPVA